MLGSLGHLIGGARFKAESAPSRGLRVTLVPLTDPDPLALAARPEALPATPNASELGAPEARSVIAGPRYFTAAELDQRPAAVSAIDLEYPAAGPPRAGYLVARILINEHGRADGVQILVSDPAGAFDRLVTEAFAAGRYQPGRKNGVAVKSQMIVEVKFEPESPPGEMPPELLPPEPQVTR